MNPIEISKDPELLGSVTPLQAEILSPEALEFFVALQREFNPRRVQLLQERKLRQEAIDRGEMPSFLPETKSIREENWRVLPVPEDLKNRRVEITGPVDRKMVINALNSGANCYMADFEDAHSPTWEATLDGQLNLWDAVRGAIEYTSPEGKSYRLNQKVATLLVRPRGWHLDEKHIRVDGEPASASLFDFAFYFFHNARYRKEHGSGVYLYLPKLEHHLEARLWNDVFRRAQEILGIPQGTIKATVLIETILAAFQMEEILYELRDHSAGLNCGRWDYLFSYIKKFARKEDFIVPDRAQVTMTSPFMRAYALSCIKACHKRGAFAMGGMAAFIPSRRDPDVNERALAKVRDDKLREAGDGFDGSWVAHPDLVPVCAQVFDDVLGERPNQLDRLRDDVTPDAKALIDLHGVGGAVTGRGLRANVSVGVRYLQSWLAGNSKVSLLSEPQTVRMSSRYCSTLFEQRRNPQPSYY